MLQYRTNAGGRHVPMLPAGKATHLISDEEMGKLFRYLDRLEAEGLKHPVIPLAIHLQFEFADSKTGGMSKPMSEEAYRLLSTSTGASVRVSIHRF